MAGELGWRQVRELNHIVKELHGPHDVLILRGGGGKQAGWARNSNLGRSPKAWLYPHGSSDPRDKRPRDYRQFPSPTGVHSSPRLHKDAGMDTVPKAEPQLCPWEPCIHPLSARRAMGGQRCPRDRRWPSPKAELLVALPSGRTPGTPQLSPHRPCFGPFSEEKHSTGGMAGPVPAPGRAQHHLPRSCRGWTQCTPAPTIPKHPVGPGWPFLSLAPAQPCFIPSVGYFLLYRARFWAATGSVLELCFPGTCSAHLEEVLHMLPGCFLPHGWVGVFAHHVIDGLHDVQHFLEGRGTGLQGQQRALPPPGPQPTPFS